jgi:uncharacterized protein (TIGR02118 family)
MAAASTTTTTTPVTALLLCYRRPDITNAAFRTYIEETHVPLVKALLGVHHPQTHTRYYTNKEAGFALGTPSGTDPDLVAVLTFENPDAMRQSMQARQADGTRETIEADEDRFMDRAKLKLIVMGEGDVGRSLRDG